MVKRNFNIFMFLIIFFLVVLKRKNFQAKAFSTRLNQALFLTLYHFSVEIYFLKGNNGNTKTSVKSAYTRTTWIPAGLDSCKKSRALKGFWFEMFLEKSQAKTRILICFLNSWLQVGHYSCRSRNSLFTSPTEIQWKFPQREWFLQIKTRAVWQEVTFTSHSERKSQSPFYGYKVCHQWVSRHRYLYDNFEAIC